MHFTLTANADILMGTSDTSADQRLSLPPEFNEANP